MTPFGVLRGRAAMLPRANVDTDQIIPARFLRKPRAAGYQAYLFADLRNEEPDFPLRGGEAILVAGENFGCGSSREGAVYALVDAGIRCVIAPSFGDIFAGNAGKNGLLTVTLPTGGFAAGEMIVDLPAQLIRAGDRHFAFAIDPFRKKCLIEGLDDIDLTLEHAASIAAHEASLPAWTMPRA